MTAAFDGATTNPVTMVLVTDQFECQRLITAGRRLADEAGNSLAVINVSAAGSERNHQALEHLFCVSRENGATMMIHYSDNPAHFISGSIRDQATMQVVTGLPNQEHSLLHRIWTRFTKVAFYTVDLDGALSLVTRKDWITV